MTAMDATAQMMEQATAQALGRAETPKATASREEARETAIEFEANFLSQMLRQMFKGIETDGMFGGGHAESVNRSLMMEEYGKVLARNGGIGLADDVMSEILKAQEGRQ